MWYDQNTCHDPWNIVIEKFKKQINKTPISTRICCCGLLSVVDFIEQNVVSPLCQAWEVYTNACKEEYKALTIKSPKYVYNHSDAKDFFLWNLPVVLVYKSSKFGPQEHLTKRLIGVDWANLIEMLQWPTLDKLVKEESMKHVKDFIKPALSFASTSNDHLLKCMLTLIVGESYMSQHCILEFDKKELKQNETKTKEHFKLWEHIKDT